MIDEEVIKRKFERLDASLNERSRRQAAAAEAMALGRGGISAVARATGISQVTICKGIQELKSEERLSQGRIRQMGSGRKKTVDKDVSLAVDLERLMEPVNKGDLESQLRWTCKSVRQLAAELQDLGHQVSYQLVSELLRNLGYSLQAYREVRECGDYTFRDNQFAYLNAQAKSFVSKGWPVISIDIMQKDMLRNDTNSGQLGYLPVQAKEKYINNFLGDNSAFVTPYSTFEPAHDASWKKRRIDLDTVTFAVESLRHWWNEEGKSKFPRARKLLIGTPGVGIQQLHAPLWHWELQRLADETRLKINFCDLPEGTSKWCKIEHHLFARINQIVRGKSLTNYTIILRNIAINTPNTELIVQCHLDTNTYHADRKFSNEEMSSIRLVTGIFPDDWNYAIYPSDTSY
jgi:transposase